MATVPPHDHSSEDAGGETIAPTTASVAQRELPHSYVVYNRDGETRAFDNSSEQEEFHDSDATTVIQQAVDAVASADGGGGTIFLKAGEYRIGPSEIRLRSHVHLLGEGPGATVLKLRDGINGRRGEQRSTVISVGENVEHASIRSLEIDGNESGNRDVPPYPMSPHHHGILIHGSSAKVPEERKPAHILVEDVHVHDTVRSNVVLAGRNCRLENLRLENSATDHWLYMGGATNCTVDGLYLGGFARTEGVVLGTDGRRCTGNTITNVNISGIEETPYQNNSPEGFHGRYPSFAFSLRPGEEELRGNNAIRDVDIRVSGARAGHGLAVRHPNTEISGLTYQGPFNDWGILNIGAAGTGSHIRDTTLRVDGAGNRSAGSITNINASDVLLDSVTIEDVADVGVPALNVVASDGALDHLTLRDTIVSADSVALAVIAAEGPVERLVVDNLYDKNAAGVETQGDVGFARRDVLQ